VFAELTLGLAINFQHAVWRAITLKDVQNARCCRFDPADDPVAPWGLLSSQPRCRGDTTPRNVA
jgi:hypothetical protein